MVSALHIEERSEQGIEDVFVQGMSFGGQQANGPNFNKPGNDGFGYLDDSMIVDVSHVARKT